MGVRGLGFRKEKRGKQLRWVIDFRYTDKDGVERRFRRDATVQSAAGARAEAEKFRLEAVTTGCIQAARPQARTFGEFVEKTFKRVYLPAKCRPATRERYVALFGQGILDALGSKRLDQIRAQDFRAYEAELSTRGIQPRHHLSLVRTVLRVAVEFGALERFPDLPTLPRTGRKLPDAPSDDEVRALLSCSESWLRTAIALAGFAGLRSGEVRALEVRDVDFERGVLLVRRAYSADEVLTPKSGDERLVPLAPELRTLLEVAVRSKFPKARVVLDELGKTPTRQTLLARLKALQVRHGLPERSFHSLRHAFCSSMVRRGASLEAVRRLAGHSALAVTERYVHATGADLEAAIAMLTGNGGETKKPGRS